MSWLLCVFAVAAVACSSADSTTPTTTERTAAKAPSAPVLAEPDDIDVNLVGDWLPNPGPFIEDPDYGSVTDAVAQRFLADDLTIANLECAVTEEAEVQPSAGFAIRCLPEDLDQLVESGVDVVTVANDQITDFGLDGINQTLAAVRDTGMTPVGPGATPVAIETASGAVTVVALARNAVVPLPDQEVIDAVRAAAALGHPVIVSIQWGTEDRRAADPEDRALAERMVAAGASVIMGHGAGRLHAFSMVDDAAVFFGLGRFVFPIGDEDPTLADTAVGSVAIDGDDIVLACLLPATLTPAGVPAFDHREPGC